MKENILNKAGECIICCIIILFFTLATRSPEAIGESDDYMLTTIALQNHGSIRITEDDVKRAMKDFPEHAWYFEASWEAGMPALFTIKENEVYPWYMGTYSLTCIPVKLCLKALGLNQSYAFALTNAAWAMLAIIICWRKLRASLAKRLAVIFMLGFSPIWWYIRWPSAEVFIFSLVVISLTYFANKQYYLAGLFISAAGTMNIAVMALGLLIIIDYTKNTCQKHFADGQRNIWKIMKTERKGIFLLILCYIPALITPVFNIAKFGIMNLQSILGFATIDGYFQRVITHLFDLNIGFLAYFTIAFVLFIILAFVEILKRKWGMFVYFSAFILTVIAYSITYHINSGMEGLPRYSAWAFPIFVFGLVLENGLSKKCTVYTFNILLVLSSFFTVLTVCEKRGDLEQTNVAAVVLDHFPEIYNPYYTVFASRVAGIPGGYIPYQEQVPEAITMGTNYEDYLPIIYCDSAGNVRKILTIPELADNLPLYFDGSAADIKELQNSVNDIKDNNKLQYINLHGNLKIKSMYLNFRFAYTYGKTLKANSIVPLGLFKVTDLGNITESSIEMPAGAFQYGPYMPLQQGDYVITITGKGLSQLEESVLVDNQLADIIPLTKNNEQIQYILNLSADAESVEFRGLNIGDDTLEITLIEVFLWEQPNVLTRTGQNP